MKQKRVKGNVPPIVPTAQAKITEIRKDLGYTEQYGSMDGANFYVLIPDNWTNPLGDKMLVVICRPALYFENPRDDTHDYPLARALAMQGIAAAASNYGPAGSGVKDGVIRTHQLTTYVVDSYDVTGKVFLFGTSLGGCVALLLGERHPDVYSGVLDNSGVKDWTGTYNDAASYSGSDPFLVFWNKSVLKALEETYGGPPQEKPLKYARDSPTHHANMAIPVISVVHENDMIVNPVQTEWYHAALSNPSLQKVVYVTTVTPGTLPYPGATGWYGHFDPATFSAADENLLSLMSWSNTLNP